jgi:hypothetical protein
LAWAALAVLVVAVAAAFVHWRFGKAGEIAEFPSPTPTAVASASVRFSDSDAGLPPDVSVRKALEIVLTAWVEGLVSGDFTRFHRSLSESWRIKDGPADLLAAYRILAPYKENLRLFPVRGKLTLRESNAMSGPSLETAAVKDNLGPETPWVVRGEWRVDKTALGFTLVLSFEEGHWRPAGLRVEIYP